MKPIQFVDPAARWAETEALTESRLLAVMRSGQFIGGPVVAEVEKKAAELFGRRHGFGTASGTDALMIGLQALGVGPGDEVIVPAFGFFATAGAVAAIGAVPVCVDVRGDATLDPVAAKRAVTTRTAAVVPVHLFGNVAEVPKIGVPVLDDAAQSVGGPPLGRGSLTAVSTYPTKTWGAAGDGGFLLGDDPELVENARKLGFHGRVDGEHHKVGSAVGRNSRLDAVQAAVLLGQVDALPRRIEHRRKLAARYDAGLPEGVHFLPRHPKSPVAQYCIILDNRDEVAEKLLAKGIHTRVYYPRSLPDEPAIARRHKTPVADWLAQRILALPVHSGVSDKDADRVLRELERAVG